MVVFRALMTMILVTATYIGCIEIACFIFEGKKAYLKPGKNLFNIKSAV